MLVVHWSLRFISGPPFSIIDQLFIDRLARPPFHLAKQLFSFFNDVRGREALIFTVQNGSPAILFTAQKTLRYPPPSQLPTRHQPVY